MRAVELRLVWASCMRLVSFPLLPLPLWLLLLLLLPLPAPAAPSCQAASS